MHVCHLRRSQLHAPLTKLSLPIARERKTPAGRQLRSLVGANTCRLLALKIVKMPTTPLHEQRSYLRSHQSDPTSGTVHTRNWLSRARRRISEGVMSVFRELVEWYRALLSCIPGETGCTLRNRLYGFHGGPRVRVLPHVLIYHPSKLVIGARTGIAAHCQMNAGGEIDIGSDVLIGPNVMIWSQNHVYESRSIPINFRAIAAPKLSLKMMSGSAPVQLSCRACA